MLRIPQNYFYLGQILLGALFIVGAWLFLRPKPPESAFRVREADLPRPNSKTGGPPERDLAQARLKRNEPLRLEGIRIDGPPHEILGVRPDATAQEIQAAYKERMKRYHPDRVARPDSPQWKDAQRIAEAINRAKAELLARRRG